MRPFVLSLSFIVALYLLCAQGVAADDATTTKTQTFARSELDVELPVSTSLSIFKPKDFTAEKSYPLVVYLHGFCLGDDAQQLYSFTAARSSPGGGGERRQTLTQISLLMLIITSRTV